MIWVQGQTLCQNLVGHFGIEVTVNNRLAAKNLERVAGDRDDHAEAYLHVKIDEEIEDGVQARLTTIQNPDVDTDHYRGS